MNKEIKKNFGIFGEDNYIFVVVKPGFLDKTKYVIETFERYGFNIAKIRTKQLLKNETKKLYKVHKDEDFYNDLCKYMSSGPSCALIFAYKSKKDIFKLSGEIKDKIRKKYGESDMRNVIHSSDSYEAMQKEMGIYF